MIWVPGRGTAWRHAPGRQALREVLHFLGFADELPGGDEFPPGDASLLGSISGDFGCCWIELIGKNNGIVVTGSSKLFSIDFDRNERLIRWNSEIEL